MASCSEVTNAARGEDQPETVASQKREAMLRKFRELHYKRNEAQKLNLKEVEEEDKRKELPSNWEAKKAQLEWELSVQQKKKDCAAQGEDYDRVKLLDVTANDADHWMKKKKKKNPDTGFAGYAEAQLRQYQRLTKQIRPDMESYEKQKEEGVTLDIISMCQKSFKDMGGIGKGIYAKVRDKIGALSGADFYPTSNTLIHGTHVPSADGIDRMVEDVEKQITKRAKYSRRRAYNDDADIDYINERNAKFNKKAERFYGKYTAEIKQNLERGTAV